MLSFIRFIRCDAQFFGFGINLILILINFDSLFLLQMKHWTRFFTANKTFDTFFYCK